MSRKIPDEIQKVFDKYTKNFTRRLNKADSITMFKADFGLDDARAEYMFEMFDQDKNKQLSIWEFYHFHTAFGKDANEYLDTFDKIQTDGNADIPQAWDFLKTLTTLGGRCVTDLELEGLIKGFAGEEKSLDKKKFTELICKIKMSRSKESSNQ